MVNDLPDVTPADAYQTMIGYKFDNEYHDISEFNEVKEQGGEPPSNWRVMDHTIDEFIRQEGVIDAFTALIFEAYTPERQVPPQRVKADTNSIKGEASLSVEERFAAIIVKGENSDVLFTQEIKIALRDNGLGTFSNGKIDDMVKHVYNIEAGMRPSRDSKQALGFRGLRISESNYNEKEERLKKTEHLKQAVRMGFTNPNASDPPGFSQTRLNTERLDQARLNAERFDPLLLEEPEAQTRPSLPRPPSIVEQRVLMRADLRCTGVHLKPF
jgi:hypothetical protein